MMIPDGWVGESVGWYAEVASGARNGLFNTIGEELIAYHDSIGDTKPIYVRSTWEVPGEWFNWNVAASQDVNTFKAAWAQFATALRANGRGARIKTVFDFNCDRGPPDSRWSRICIPAISMWTSSARTFTGFGPPRHRAGGRVQPQPPRLFPGLAMEPRILPRERQAAGDQRVRDQA